MINTDKLRDTPLLDAPFPCVVVEDFIKPDALKKAIADYPQIPGPGSHPPASLTIKGQFKKLIHSHLLGAKFQSAIEHKFNIALKNNPTMYTVRGFCRAKDGQIHTDSRTKIITVLLYMNNPEWDASGGRLRLLNNGNNLADYFYEIEPKGGTLLAFRRTDNSWHGHLPYEGPRRAVQLNWVTDTKIVAREQARHARSSFLKRIRKFVAQPA